MCGLVLARNAGGAGRDCTRGGVWTDAEGRGGVKGGIVVTGEIKLGKEGLSDKGVGMRVSRKGRRSTCWGPCGAGVGQDVNCRQVTGMGSRERCLGHDEITDHEGRR